MVTKGLPKSKKAPPNGYMDERSRTLPIVVLSILFIIVMMIPITGLLVAPLPPEPLNTPIFELGNRTLNEVFVDNAQTLSTRQLVTNSDFSNGTTGWVNDSTALITLSNGNLKLLGNNTSNFLYTYQNNTLINGVKTYYNAKIKLTSPTNVKPDWLSIYDGNDSSNRMTSFTLDTFFNISNLITQNATAIYLLADYGSSSNQNTSDMEIEHIIAFNISTLISNKQFSPLFNTTFDLMTDANIKTQMDTWVNDGLGSLNIWLTYNYLGLDQILTKLEMEYYYNLYVYYVTQ